MKREPLRLALWLALGLACYAISMWVGPQLPQTQAAFWKAGHVTIYGWVGYWIARGSLGRINREGKTPAGAYIARGIIVAGAMLAGAHGI